MMHRAGDFLEQDDAKAVQLFQDAVEKGNTKAMLCLAMMYQQGLGVAEDEQKAVELLASAAEQGDAEAQYTLGRLLHKAGHIQEAISLFMAASQQGNGAASYALSTMYDTGEAGVKSETEMVQLLGAAVEQGYPPALFDMGRMMLEMVEAGMAPDPEEGWENGIGMLREAALRGEARAAAFLRQMGLD